MPAEGRGLGSRLPQDVGQPNKLTVIFGHRITERYRGKLQTVIEDMNLPNPVIRSHYKNGFIKQYVRDNRLFRTEAATNNVNDGWPRPRITCPNYARRCSASRTATRHPAGHPVVLRRPRPAPASR